MKMQTHHAHNIINKAIELYTKPEAKLMNDDYEGLAHTVIRHMISQKIVQSDIGRRLELFGLKPKFSTWAYLDHGKPTLDCGILFVGADSKCVGMYHLPTGRILISKVGLGLGGVPCLSQFAHIMDECKSADEFFEMLPARLELLEQAQLSYKEWQARWKLE